MERPQQLLPVLHELLERLEGHLKAEEFYSGKQSANQKKQQQFFLGTFVGCWELIVGNPALLTW